MTFPLELIYTASISSGTSQLFCWRSRRSHPPAGVHCERSWGWWEGPPPVKRLGGLWSSLRCGITSRGTIVRNSPKMTRGTIGVCSSRRFYSHSPMMPAH